MKKNFISLSLILIIGIALISCNQNNNSQNKSNSTFAELKGPYLGQKPPGMTPEIFAPGIISNGLFNGLIYFTANGSEVYFTSGFEKPFYISMLFYSCMKDGRWLEPMEVPFKRAIFHRPVLNPQGNKLFFISSQAEEKSKGESNPVKIYYSEKMDENWSVPMKIDFGEAFPYSCSQTSIASSGNLYFQAGYYIDGDEDIYMSKLENGKYMTPLRLSDKINGPDHDSHPFIAPDESYIIFDAYRPEGFGNNDLYISFRDSNGEWTEAKNMGPHVNSERDERRSTVSFDSKYLFFESKIPDGLSKLPEQALSLKELQEFTCSAENGSADIYWVDAKIIEVLKDQSTK